MNAYGCKAVTEEGIVTSSKSEDSKENIVNSFTPEGMTKDLTFLMFAKAPGCTETTPDGIS